jgi:uncharacterized protein (TIGR02145 family)
MTGQGFVINRAVKSLHKRLIMKHIFTISLCFLALSLSAQVDCPNTYDGNADGAVTINDLLDLLAVFGDTDTDSDGIWDSIDDCIDLTACNYANDPTEACNYIDVLGVCGGGCDGDSDNDGICDDIDDCIGVVDECGVCNGPGATEVVIESITLLYDSVYLPQLEEWYVYEFGADTTFSFTCEPVFNSCGEVVSHEGYDYSTVQIGDQCWFSENCRYLPVVSPSSEGSESDPYYYVYDYQGSDVTAAQATTNYATYGVLYNWPAVMTEGICPSGWHIPSDGEWQTMEMSLGMSESEAADWGWRGTDEGYQMKSSSGWNSGGNGSNSSGYTGLPGGYRYSGGFLNHGDYGHWWSASGSGSFSWLRALFISYDNVGRGDDNRNYGFSARCVRDYTDECGVLNGDNSTCADDCGVPNGDNSTCLDECGVPNGDNSTCADDCGVPNGDNSTCFISCGDQIAHDGYDYSTVQIGEQCWFAENCRYLPVVSPSSAGSETSPYYYVYGYEGSTVSEAKATTNYETYGVLYNWPAVMTDGICPSGWHIPSDGEFTELTDFLGGEDVAGGKMKEAGYDHWNSPNEGATNSSGWTGLPGGIRSSGGFIINGYDGHWWSASESGSYSWKRWLFSNNDDVNRYDSYRSSGFSARCVRD